MTRPRQSRLRAVMLAAIVAAGAGLHCRADVVSNCFKVVNYTVNWHVECTLDGFTDALDIAIDDNTHNGWRAFDHGSRAYVNLAAVESSETIDAGTFIWTTNMVEFVDQSDFIVAFAIGCSEPNRIDGNFGWVRLAYEGGAIVLKGGAINTTQGSPLVAEGVLPSFVNPETGCETNTFYMTRESPPRILHLRDVAFDFSVLSYTEHCWSVGVQHSRGKGYVATVPAATYVGDSTFSQQRKYDGYEGGDLFFLAFKWEPDANDTTRRTRYGWLAIGLKDGVPAVLASEMSETAGVPLVARGFEGVDDGADESVEGVIWRCNFNNGVQGMEITNMPEVASHTLLVGNEFEALIDDGRYSGRFCAGIDGSYGARAWFSVNERSTSGLGPRYVPGKWHTLRTSFKINSHNPCGATDGGLYAEMPPSPQEGNARGLRVILLVPGSIINIDDKLALRYCESEYDEGSYWWEVNAGITNGVGTLEAQTVRLVEKERGDEPASPVKNWVEVEIEAVNDDSPYGLAYRIYIDGALLCSEEDGSTVFRARPAATDKSGVTALGIGGMAFIDNIVFSSTTIDPLSGVRISPSKFGQGNVELTEDELANLAGIIGFDSLSGLERITMYPWEDDSGSEPLDSPKVCIDLGISPCHVKSDSDDGKGIMLFFKYPTVRAVGIDPASRTVTGQIVPAEGTRIVCQPLNFMFGIKHYIDFGTPYAHTEDYGGSIYQNYDGWQLDISDYAASNGLFRITYDPKFSDEGSAFFLLSIKDCRYWW